MNNTESVRQAIIDRIFNDRAHRSELLKQRTNRQQQGWEVAQQAAQILKDKFGVQRVVLFGSMLDVNEINWRSDIDLAVWGLGKFDLFKAGAAVDRGHDFVIDLVPVEEARPHILPAINQGVEL